jgi:hypothetical protein
MHGVAIDLDRANAPFELYGNFIIAGGGNSVFANYVVVTRLSLGGSRGFVTQYEANSRRLLCR